MSGNSGFPLFLLTMQKILFVCLGNICRSPMAHGVFRDIACTQKLNVEIDSAGTSDHHTGEAPDSRAVSTMANKNIDITDLRARQFTREDFDRFDFIYVMDDSNYKNVIALASNQSHRNKVTLFLNEAFPGKNQNVPDPYFGGDEGFEHVYELITAASLSLAEKLK